MNNINHITLSALDIDESFNFYTKILGMKPLVKWERGAYFLAGNIWFCLSLDSEFRPTKQKGHFAFTATTEEIHKIKLLISKQEVKEWTKDTSEGESVYFLDPSGNQLELHKGDWKSRIESIKSNPYSGNIEFFEELT